MEVKVCGITRLEDALAAVECGVDALGFVFYSHSPRCITPQRALGIIQRLPPGVSLVGVFVDERPETVRAMAQYLGLDMVQLHGQESPGCCQVLEDMRVIKALRIRGPEDLPVLEQYKGIWAVLLDGFDPARHSCTGQMANWDMGPVIGARHPLVLAGGLGEENLAQAVARALPDALDVSSSVERSAGQKDHRKLRRFLELARGLGSPRPGRGVFSVSDRRPLPSRSERGMVT